MQLPTAKNGFLKFFLPATAGGSVNASSDVAKSWPAPARKHSGLVLKSSVAGRSDRLAQSGNPPAWSSAMPFPAPVQEDAFAVPRPAIVPGASSPWASSLQKYEALIQRRSAAAVTEAEFSRPLFGEKLSARHPGGLCRSC
jgi:hypothetical protein